MRFNKIILASLFAGFVFISGCTITNNLGQSKFITVKGVPQETKDGYYLNEYLVQYSEIRKYDPGHTSSKYWNTTIEVVGKEKEVTDECQDYEQCRGGSYKLLYDIQSIKIFPTLTTTAQYN